ncbi:hypothetical protein BKA56DRAFT_99466 [Ilyonectria sp. MPI-CAGE-AT-0026]|nr:hypothetical protein BKA56DRAFT_99466 [Ilyonectria sp. MPI-CAGE-AT-0026]
MERWRIRREGGSTEMREREYGEVCDCECVWAESGTVRVVEPRLSHLTSSDKPYLVDDRPKGKNATTLGSGSIPLSYWAIKAVLRAHPTNVREGKQGDFGTLRLILPCPYGHLFLCLSKVPADCGSIVQCSPHACRPSQNCSFITPTMVDMAGRWSCSQQLACEADDSANDDLRGRSPYALDSRQLHLPIIPPRPPAALAREIESKYELL